MNYLGRIIVTGFFSCALFGVTAVKADPEIVGTVQLDAEPGVYPGLGGGEFTAYTSQNFAQNYATVATYNGGFETFCLETGEDFTPNNWGGPTYYYSLGSTAQPLSGGGAGSGLPLTAGAAWLYQEFATGGLSSYGFDYTYGTDRQSDDNLLQAAIWALQGGQTYSGYPSVDSTENGNPFYIDAINALGANVATNAYAGSSVEVLQLWDNPDGTGPAQNQLVYVPDGGGTVGLLGIGLMGVFLVQFRRRKLA